MIRSLLSSNLPEETSTFDLLALLLITPFSFPEFNSAYAMQFKGTPDLGGRKREAVRSIDIQPTPTAIFSC